MSWRFHRNWVYNLLANTSLLLRVHVHTQRIFAYILGPLGPQVTFPRYIKRTDWCAHQVIHIVIIESRTCIVKRIHHTSGQGPPVTKWRHEPRRVDQDPIRIARIYHGWLCFGVRYKLNGNRIVQSWKGIDKYIDLPPFLRVRLEQRPARVGRFSHCILTAWVVSGTSTNITW
jgi:hypothetical protein